MKKIILLACFSFTMMISQAQVLTNAGFDSWNNLIFFYEPQGYVTTNYASVILGTGGLPVANVSRSSSIKHSGTYAAKLESYAQSPGDQLGIPGAMIAGSLDLANVNIKPGFPYAGRPEELRGFFKYQSSTILPDSGIVSVALTKYDPLAGPLNIVGAGLGVINPSSGFVELNIPIFYTGNDIPDTAIIIISTSSSFSLDTSDFVNAPVGSVLYVDDLSFFGTASGVEKIDDLMNSLVYPNPSKDIVNVDFYQSNASNVEVTIISADGKVIYNSNEYKGSGLQQLNINVAEYSEGMYFLKIKNSDGQIVKKLSVE